MAINTYTALRTTNVATAVSSVSLDLSGIVGYTDIVIECVPVVTTSGTVIYTRFNNDTSGNYSSTLIVANVNNINSVYRNNSSQFDSTGYSFGMAAISSWNYPTKIEVMNYANQKTFKSCLITSMSRDGSERMEVSRTSGTWASKNAVTSVTIFPSSGNFDAGSTFTVYGIASENPYIPLTGTTYTPGTVPGSLNIGDQVLVSYTGSSQTINLPAGMNTCKFEVVGARGANLGTSGKGGFGGYAAGIYDLEGNAKTVYAYIGGAGTDRSGGAGGGLVNPGGYNGGGDSRYASNSSVEGYAGVGGGGASDFRIGGTALSNRVIVAGGGAGASGSAAGGAGGGFSGVKTVYPYGDFNGGSGNGGTQSAGGTGGQGNGGYAPNGALGVGGAGGTNNNEYGQGGGGGGGYYGGGGGGGHNNGNGGPGGGGSSYVGTLASSTTVGGINNSNGYAVITRVS